MKDHYLLVLIVSNAGGGNPKTALKPLLTNRSLSLATISLALLVTLGSCESLRMRGANLFTASIVSVAAFLSFDKIASNQQTSIWS